MVLTLWSGPSVLTLLPYLLGPLGHGLAYPFQGEGQLSERNMAYWMSTERNMDFECMGVGTPNPTLFKGQLYSFTSLVI